MHRVTQGIPNCLPSALALLAHQHRWLVMLTCALVKHPAKKHCVRRNANLEAPHWDLQKGSALVNELCRLVNLLHEK